MIEPRSHNPQTQPITVALKNICRDYPAGGGVLRELLQNADDAGASSVKFVLDQTSYPAATLVHPDLAEYQGPSLLAYNDATFSEKDFASLSRIGDSCKIQDVSTTGRFGRGFNAVYNWTDSPSIVSRDSLLILDPHHTWTGHFKNPGGPVYDFVDNAKNGFMQDQMAAFSAITEAFDREFHGTIIRIPLRTSEQAQKSQICGREATCSEIAQVLQTFMADFGHTGLLFMKNVSQITIVVGDKPPMSICITNHEEVRRHKSDVNAAVKKTILEGRTNFNNSFEIEIKRVMPDKEENYRFAIHHSIQNYPEDESLSSWTKEEAMVPWVAVASEVKAKASETISGSLYNVLPSQIRINQPIHIHSCFSMSPDRARLHELGDNSVQYPLPGRWNHWLFDELIPTAWTNLLIYLAQQYPDRQAFEMWPNSQEDKNDISYGIEKKVLQIVEQNNYSLWYTDIGYVTLRSGLVSKNDSSSAMRTALTEAGVPVIYLADSLFTSVETTCKVEYLTPQTLCDRLEQGQKLLRMISEEMKQTLLDYVISDPHYRGYGAVELFPFEDGSYKALDNEVAFCHRDEDERLLFLLEKNRNIDLQKLSRTALQVFQNGCSTSSLHSSLRRRSTYDLKTYCLRTYFKAFNSTEDLISVDEEICAVISKVWEWISTREYSILDENVSCLWLLPLTDGRYRKIKPTDTTVDTIYAALGDIGDFLRHLESIKTASNKPIIRTNELSPRSLQLLKDAMKKDRSLLIKSSDSIEDFMLWLDRIREVFDVATDSDRWYLHKLLASRLPACKNPKTVISDILRGLKVFQSVFWRAEGTQMVLHQKWVTLNEHSNLIGLRQIDLLPDLGQVTFLNANSDDTERLLRYFGLAKCPPPLELLEKFMIPFWEDEKVLRSWTVSGKEKITESLLRDFHNLEKDAKKRISSLAIVPVKPFNGKCADKFSIAKELINPSVGNLLELYFDDEEVCPAEWALENYSGILITCGLRTALDDHLVVERVKCFAKRSQEIEETSKRARKLLQSSPLWKTGQDNHETSPLRERQWLPVKNLQGSTVFKNAKECRSMGEKTLVGYVLPVLDFEISQDWQNRLGWNNLIPHITLVTQLAYGIGKGDRKTVDAVLRYVSDKGQVDGVRQDLMQLSCIMASNGQFVPIQKVFRSGCERLQPYFYSVDRSFWFEHRQLLKILGVAGKPKFEDLLAVHNQLPSQEILNKADIPVAIEIAKLASIFTRSQISQFKILDDTGRLRVAGDVTFNDLGSSTITGTFNSIHPDVPKTVIDAFWIEPLSARVKKGELGVEDDADDEFDQHQDVATAISDTLTRYTVESTFKEFLANADDCKATELNWLLDKTEYPKSHLLTTELGKYQGPALLVHNDKVFSKEDFDGLRDVGRGSKEDDAETIGKFGKGSQTMYHWTDVPMLLSGEWLVILDPLRQVLDLNYRTGRRKPGIKIKLAKFKGAYRNQLAPFEGLWGFSQELDYYPGTIFRFPLRPTNAQSKLVETGTSLDFEATRRCLENFLEKEGRISLLFLRNIQFMDFKIHRAKEPRWSIQSDKRWSISGWTYCTITKCFDETSKVTFIDRWRVAIEDPDNVPSELQYRHRRKMKNVECGIAALVPDSTLTQTPIFRDDPVPRYFSTLPLAFPTDLPVHVHATFALASDRASFPIEDSMQKDGAKWNRWLLSSAIPELYLDFLKDLGRETIKLPNPFAFWPQDSPSKGHLSEPIYNSFWQTLPKSPYKLFPVSRQVEAAQLKKREPPKLVTVHEAVFDLLEESRSVALRKIFESQIPTLVRPPLKIRTILQKVTELKSVTPKRLRELFKEEDASKCLEKAVSVNHRLLEILLGLIGPSLEEDFTALDGCRILPLADRTLGTLRLASSVKKDDHYFLANDEELRLFDFTLGRLVAPEPGKEFKKAILDSKKFNVTRLGLFNLGTLLERMEYGDKSATVEIDTWLIKFWDYCHRTEVLCVDTKTPFTSSLDIRCHPIFRATCNRVSSYVEPERLDLLPSVIEPNKLQQRSLCSKFPGIHMFNFSYLPTHLRTTETSLDSRASFARFITTISKLAQNEGDDLEVYIKKYLGTDEIKLLQKLVIKYVSAEPSIKNHNMRSPLRSLPVWPTTKSSLWISATAGLATDRLGLQVPWMTGYHSFIEQNTYISNLSTLGALGVYEVPGVEVLSRAIINLPPNVLDIHIYRSFISAIPQISNWRNVLLTLRQSRMAPNRAKLLVPACDLFDHKDEIFTSAFRNEADQMFLLRELEESEIFWREIGLKHRVNGQFAPADYLSCLKKMRERLEGFKDQASYAGIVMDALAVLRPLTTPSTALGRLSGRDWSAVADQATFPTTIIGRQSSYRRKIMEIVAIASQTMQLSDVIGSQHMPICWSQIPFPVSQPTVETLAKLASKGKPSTAMVWRHLEHMASSIMELDEDAVADFLSDLYDTYDYLQDNLEDSVASFTVLQGSQVWFNLDLTDNSLVRKIDLELHRCSIENLILESSCDTTNLQSVREGLIRYQKLLRALGCKSIVYPSVDAPETHTNHLVSTDLRRLRSEELLLDLTLEGESGSVRAHKVVMAASSGFFARQFKDHWSNHDNISLKPFTHSTLSSVVDFAYADTFDWTSMQVQEDEYEKVDITANKLDDFLDLLEAAEYLDMPDLKVQAEAQILYVSKLFIREHNVLGVLKRASDAKAGRVAAYCTDFYARNQEAVDLAMKE